MVSVKLDVSVLMFLFTSGNSCSHKCVLLNIAHTRVWRADRIVVVLRCAYEYVKKLGTSAPLFFFSLLNHSAILSVPCVYLQPFYELQNDKLH